MKSLPIVALIGQTNAGKSSLLNRFARKNIAIVAREEGTTRDNVIARIEDRFLLIDTAGLKDPEDDFEAGIQDQIADAIDSAEIILMTVDSTKYFDHHDKNIAKSALKSKKPIFLLLNKSDRGEALHENEFRALGIPEDRIFHTSATTGQGIKELKTAILQTLSQQNAHKSFAEGSEGNALSFDARTPAQNINGQSVNSSLTEGLEDNALSFDARTLAQNASTQATETRNDGLEGACPSIKSSKRYSAKPLKIALIGRPNVGKSSLFNSLGKKQQALVSSRQGTTRDINRINIRYNKRDIEILDTAGLRRPGKREVGIEKFSAIRTLAAIEEADVCALLVDSTEPHSKLDQSLAGQIVEAGKGIIVVVTKLDLFNAKEEELAKQRAEKKAEQAAERAKFEEGEIDTKQPTEPENRISPIDRLIRSLEYDFNFLPYAPVLLTSSETGKNVTKLFEIAEQVDEARKTELKTSDLNRILREAIAAHPPAGLKNTHPKPKYIVQTDTNPPWFVVHGHELQLLHWSYKRYLERKIREFYPFMGTPIFFSFRNNSKKDEEST